MWTEKNHTLFVCSVSVCSVLKVEFSYRNVKNDVAKRENVFIRFFASMLFLSQFLVDFLWYKFSLCKKKEKNKINFTCNSEYKSFLSTSVAFSFNVFTATVVTPSLPVWFVTKINIEIIHLALAHTTME